MIDKNYVTNRINKIKKSINRHIRNAEYEKALLLIKNCADVLYQTNICYVDEELEQNIADIASSLNLVTEASYKAKDDSIIIYDGFGLNDKGIIKIHLKALCKIKKVIYVTYEDRKILVPDIEKIIQENGCECRYIKRRNQSLIDQIYQFDGYIKEFSPKDVFIYSLPDDAVSTVVMGAYDSIINRYKINMLDDTFWLGAKFVDKCIEYRKLGASISKDYRKINESSIRLVPVYPDVNEEIRFQGYPFEKNDTQKVMFSTGDLYRTFGNGNEYYKLVDYALEKNTDLIFWYAGVGDTREMDKLATKYPNRVYLTLERTDLLQVLEHSDIYLDTFPRGDGTMVEYAKAVGCNTVSCLNDDITKDTSFLYSEIDQLLSNEEYDNKKKAFLKEAVSSKGEFYREIQKLLTNENSEAISTSDIKNYVASIRKWYLEGLTKEDLDGVFACNESANKAIPHYPLRFLRDGYAYCLEDPYKVSVVVVTYNSSFERITYTLDSFIEQEGIELEIVIADDGSVDNHFEEIQQYMREKSFGNYKLISHEQNVGTVLNFSDGLKACTGRYIKSISPGDAIIGKDCMCNWVKYMVATGKAWSFCDVVNYTRDDNGNMKVVQRHCGPQNTKSYLKHKDDDCRWNYIVLGDIATGAALICTRELMEEYINIIVNRVKYAEDNIYRIMMYDGEVACYYRYNGVMYEVGDGISTNGDSKWATLLNKDWKTSDEIILNEIPVTDITNRKMHDFLVRQYTPQNKLIGVIQNNLDKGRIASRIRHALSPRVSDVIEKI